MRPIDADALLLQETIITDENGDELNVVHGIDVRCAPTISPDEVRGVGEWLPDVGEFGFPEIPCSVCGYKSGHYGFNYCPSCGARLRNGGTDDS